MLEEMLRGLVPQNGTELNRVPGVPSHIVCRSSFDSYISEEISAAEHSVSHRCCFRHSMNIWQHATNVY